MAEHGGNPGTRHVDHADGCDLDFMQDPTSDADLPPASGGVQQTARGMPGAVRDDADGCDVDFKAGSPTTDEELPIATGGVAK